MRMVRCIFAAAMLLAMPSAVEAAPALVASSDGHESAARPVAFGPHALGSASAPRRVPLRNLGAAELHVQGWTIMGDHPGDFAIGSGCPPGSVLAAPEEC